MAFLVPVSLESTFNSRFISVCVALLLSANPKAKWIMWISHFIRQHVAFCRLDQASLYSHEAWYHLTLKNLCYPFNVTALGIYAPGFTHQSPTQLILSAVLLIIFYSTSEHFVFDNFCYFILHMCTPVKLICSISGNRLAPRWHFYGLRHLVSIEIPHLRSSHMVPSDYVTNSTRNTNLRNHIVGIQ